MSAMRGVWVPVSSVGLREDSADENRSEWLGSDGATGVTGRERSSSGVGLGATR